MLHANNLSFDIRYLHVQAHQDDDDPYHQLSRPSQLNCIADSHAKREIWEVGSDELPVQQAFPLEPVTVFVRDKKMTSDTADCIRFWAHKILAEQTFFTLGIMSSQSFHKVVLRQVYNALHDVPRLFQLWACKQVMEVAGTNLNQSYYTKGHDPHCPSCTT